MHDATVAGINKGMMPDELVRTVHLPQHLKEDPWLIEFYGTVEWSVRSIFNGYLGWFDGNPATLSPLAPKMRAERVAELAGGIPKLIKAAERALKDGEHQWVLELTDWIRRLEPNNAEVRAMRKEAMISLGKNQISANGRNYYLSAANQGK